MLTEGGLANASFPSLSELDIRDLGGTLVSRPKSMTIPIKAAELRADSQYPPIYPEVVLLQ